MTPEQVQEYIQLAIPLALSGLLGIVVLIVGWIVSKWVASAVRKGAVRAKVTPELANFLGSIARYVVLAATVISALERVGVQTTSLIAVFASAGLAIGLALQGSLANFAAGVMILFFRPFKLGDKITAGGHTGDVAEIGLFATTFDTLNVEKIIIPNSAITGGPIVNITTMGVIRGTVSVGVAYGESIHRSLEVIQKAAASAECVKQDPAPATAFTNFGASSLDIDVHCFCDAADYLTMLHNVRVAVYDALNAEGIEIPFNQIVVHQAEVEDAAAAK
ncbi:MAG: small conductance mechanosensitive channel [Myxococcota bacterium]|jgi:small conductance mechanosensitive channel